jgi:hypothetical protein
MPRRIDPRLVALERRAEVASFDAPAICRLAGECYLAGQPLPPDLTGRARRLAGEMYRFLVLSEEARWWSDEPLPMPSPPHVARPPS